MSRHCIYRHVVQTRPIQDRTSGFRAGNSTGQPELNVTPIGAAQPELRIHPKQKPWQQEKPVGHIPVQISKYSSHGVITLSLRPELLPETFPHFSIIQPLRASCAALQTCSSFGMCPTKN